MKKLAFTIVTCLLIAPLSGRAQEVEVISFEQLQEIIHAPQDQWHVVNFWATWCAPCVKELPYFEKAREKYETQGVQFTLVSLDFLNVVEKKVKPFVLKNGLGAEVLVLDQPRGGEWLAAVEENWEGGIPITLIFNNGKKIRKFIDGAVTYEALDEAISSALTQ